MGPIVFLLLPALSFASITVNIKASAAQSQAFITHYGKDSNIITDTERESFNITDNPLTATVAAYSGTKPTNVFVKRPTPWGDLYKTYNWDEVRRETKVKQDRILPVKTQEVTLVKGRYTNNSTLNGTFVCNYEHKIENVISNNFTGKNASVNVTYNVDLLLGLEPPIHLKFVSHLANNTEITDKRTLKSDSAVIFNLKPAQSATAFLNATKVLMTVEVNYATSLSGYLAVNYNPRHEGHHFWAYDVKDVLMSAGESFVQNSTNVVTVQYYTDAKIVVVDDETGKVIKSENVGY
ncbi:U-megalopygitoxin(8)-Mc8-like [Choristoneura fumiferana]|uniref:U-megalopygitoxin(8)-Mc8-like n=1 Tax=Choristoneura fumiferana TaxID=7141 RepID=UPI003D15B710